MIGMNISETSELKMFLENRKLKKIVMSPKTNGTLYPMSQIPSDLSIKKVVSTPGAINGEQPEIVRDEENPREKLATQH